MKYNLALVTGANSGLGFELCKQLASRNIPLLMSGRNETELIIAANSFSSLVPVEIHIADLSDPVSLKTLINKIHEKTPDLIINNAGIGLYGDIIYHSTQEELDIIEVNVKALTEICIEAAKALIKQNKGGTIFNVSSAAAFFSYPTFAVYAATKAFVTHFSKSFNSEMKIHNIRVLCVAPGKIATPFRDKAAKKFLSKRDLFTMKVEKAGRLILSQIDKQMAFSIIDWRYKLLTFLGRFLFTKKIIEKILSNTLKKLKD